MENKGKNRAKSGVFSNFLDVKLSLPDSKFYRLSRYLPNNIRDLFKLIDNPVEVQAIINNFGGQSILIPLNFSYDTPFLAGILSIKSAKLIVMAYGGTELYIAKGDALKRFMRDDIILTDINKLLDSSYSMRQAITVVRLKYGLCERRVRQIYKTQRK